MMPNLANFVSDSEIANWTYIGMYILVTGTRGPWGDSPLRAGDPGTPAAGVNDSCHQKHSDQQI
jgi:hypothetical protein